MYSYATLVCFLVTLTGCCGIFSPGRLTQCTSRYKPCRIMTTNRFLNGTLAGETETAGCRCFGHQSCPPNWSNSDYVITKSLISTTHNMTMNMMFCHPVAPHRLCRMDENSLVLSGILEVPTRIQAYHCRCGDGQPLQLKQRYIGRDHLTYHHYVCANHQPTCPNYISHCMLIRENSVDYNCKCPRPLQCRVAEQTNNSENFNQMPIYGFCRR